MSKKTTDAEPVKQPEARKPVELKDEELEGTSGGGHTTAAEAHTLAGFYDGPIVITRR